MSRVKHGGQICYVYEVGTEEAPRYYRTTELLFTARAPSTTGRKTRVWKVIEVEGPEEGQFNKSVVGQLPMALKDGWLDEGSRSEAETQARIFESLDSIQPDNYKWAKQADNEYLGQCLSEVFSKKDGYKEYFMEIVNSRILGKTKLRHKSAVPSPGIFPVADPKPVDACHLLHGTTQSGSHSGTPASATSRGAKKKAIQTKGRQYKVKQQHRLIYRHVGCDLNHEESLAKSFAAIYDAFIGAFSQLPPQS